MDVGGRWVVCWDVSKERGRVLQLFTHVNSDVALHVTRRVGGGVWGARQKAACKYTLALNHQ